MEGARPGPRCGRLLSGSTSRRIAVMPVSGVVAVIVYTSGDGFLPLARIEPSGCLVSVVPPLETALESRVVQGVTFWKVCSQAACLAGSVFS